MTAWCDDVVGHGSLWPNLGRYQQECDDAYKELTLVSSFHDFSLDVPTVVCVVRNEEQRLPLFIEHYLKLGVKSIHFIDNNSSDSTPDIARSYPEVTLWHTTASYGRSAFGQLWVGALVRRHGLNRWVLNLDADELFVYEGMDIENISIVQEWMVSTGTRRLYTPLVDVYADLPLNGNTHFKNELKLYFDGKKNNSSSPYIQEHSIFGNIMTGGPRVRMMSSIGETGAPALQKYALSLWDSTTAYANVHYPYPFEQNPKECFAALLHLKLLGDFVTRVHNAVFEREHWNEAFEYQLYQRWLYDSEEKKLISDEFSTEYEDPHSLVTAGIIKTAPWSKFSRI